MVGTTADPWARLLIPVSLLVLGATPLAASAQESSTLVASAVHDFDRDGRRDTLALVMLEGRRYDDTTAWCGAGEKFEGRFSLRVSLAGGDSARRMLRDFVFFRAGDRRIALGDYNGDGNTDFNLGQYRSCNGWRYRLFTVEETGAIRRLPVGDAGGGWLPVAAFANSTREIVPIGGGIRICFYDNRTGHTLRRYEWRKEPGMFVPAGERRVDGCTTGGSDGGGGHTGRAGVQGFPEGRSSSTRTA